MKDILTSSIDARLCQVHTVLTNLLLKDSAGIRKLTDADFEAIENAEELLNAVRNDIWKIVGQKTSN